MKHYYYCICIVFLFCIGSSNPLLGQCSFTPPGSAAPGCACASVDCSTGINGFVGNNAVLDPGNGGIPECAIGGVFHNDDWVGFVAGSSSISITITPTGCTQIPDGSGGFSEGIQAGIYGACTSNPSNPADEGDPSNALATECNCRTDPITLSSNQFVCGQTYYVFVDGCTGSVCDYTITVNSGQTTLNSVNPLGLISGPTTACPGSTVTYSINPVFCVPDYTWQVNGGNITSDNGTSITVNWPFQTTGTVSVTGSNSCTSTNMSSLPVTVTPLQDDIITGYYCSGEPGYNYNGNFFPESPVPYNFPVFIPFGDPNFGCSQNAQITSIRLEATAAIIQPDDISCSAPLVVVDGTNSQGDNFNWTASNGGVIGGPSNIPIIIASSPGTYCLQMTSSSPDGSLTCSDQSCVTVAQTGSSFSVNTSSNPATCAGVDDGSATVNVSGPSTYSYAWNTNPAQTSSTASGLSPGNYTVTISSADGCVDSASVVVDQGIGVDLDIQSTTIDCGGANDGTATASPIGGMGPYDYVWNTTPAQNTATVTGLAAGTYTVEITDDNGCVDIDSITLLEPPLLSVNVSGVNLDCPQDIDGTATASASGGTGAYSYTWGTIPVENTASISGLSAGTYLVTVSDANACEVVDSVVIIAPNALSATTSSNSVSCNTAQDGTATINGNGGTGPYTYIWSTVPVQTTATATGLPAGTYSVTLEDDNGCQLIESVVVDEPMPLQLSGSSMMVECNGGATGEASITVNGGTGPYTYEWNTVPIQTTATAVGLSAGTYTVEVTDDAGCTSTENVIVTELSALQATTNTQDLVCNGDANGEASVSANGGTGPYVYEWNTTPVQTTATATGLAAGNYTVEITDANGCVITESVTVNGPSAIQLSTSSTDAACGGQATGSATVNASGGAGGPYTYEWNTTPVQNTATATNLPSGTYTVEVTDANNCVNTTSVNVSEPSGVTVTTSSTDASCNGVQDGTATISGSGGTGPYIYTWSTVPVQTTATATGLSGGTYMVTLEDDNGCQVIESVIVDEPAALQLSGSSMMVECNGGSTGEASISVSGGTGPYTYSWNTVPIQTTATATGLTAGTYTVEVTDNAGCISTENVIVTEASVLLITTGFQDVNCNGDTDGEASVSVSGGTGPYTYEWNTTPVQTTATATGLTAGTYTVEVTDDNGCIITESVNVSEPSVITVTTSATDASCNGDQDGTATISGSGGNGPYTYIWSTVPVQTTATATGLPAGIYMVTLEDNNGCQIIESVDVNEPTALQLSGTSVPVDCNGESTGEASISVSGGTGPYTYAWNTTPVQTTATATDLTAGTYTVEVTDNAGCTTTENVIITEASALQVSTNAQDVFCNGDTDGEASVSVNGGTGPYSYVWNTIPVQTTATATGLAAGNYTVEITDDNGCVIIESVTINGPAAIQLTTSSTDVSCGGQATGSASVNANGGTGPYTYAWNTVPVQTTATATNLSSGTYTVEVRDANNCLVTTSVNVIEPSSVTVTTSSTDASCNGEQDGTATISGSGGTGPYTYIWSTVPVQTTATATGLSGGTYMVTLEDDNGCQVIESIVVNEPAALQLSGASIAVECNGESTGEASISVSGGTGPYTYAWNTTPIQTTSTATGLTAGTYTVEVTDNAGCTSTENVIVTEASALQATTSFQDVNCNGDTDGEASVSVSGGTGPYTYEWNTTPIQNTATATGLAAGTYTVDITDDNGCMITESVTVNGPSAIQLTTSFMDVSCSGEATGTATVSVSGGTGPYTYEWNTVPVQTSSTAVNLLSGSYTVEVTDDNGCIETTSIDIGEPSSLMVTTTATDASCNGEQDGTATISGTGGTGPYTYTWSTTPVQTTASATGLATGTYTVTLEDNNGCQVIESVVVDEPTALQLSASSLAVDCNGDSTGEASISVSGGTAPYTFSWNTVPVQTTATASGLIAGTYTVEVTDDAGCTQMESIIITEASALQGTANVLDLNCNGETDGEASVSISGGTAPYTYEWNTMPIQTTATATGLTAGTYDVLVTDANMCTYNTSVSITEPDSLQIVGISINALFGQSTGSLDITVSGGVGPYSYQWSNGLGQNEDLDMLPAGTYEVTVTDQNGCTIVQAFVVDEDNEILAISVTVNDNLCFGDSLGAIDLMVTGGEAPYTYLWDLSTGSQITEDIQNLTAGVYSVTVTDNLGEEIILSIPVAEPSEILVSSSSIASTCGQFNGSIDLSVSGGVGPYTFNWSGGVPDVEDPVNLIAGNYLVTVTDANGCTIEYSEMVDSPTDLQIDNIAANAVTCNGDSNGGIDLTVSGGTMPYSFIWDDNLAQTIEDPINLPAGNYSVTVTDDADCSTVASINVEEPESILITSSVSPKNCGINNGEIDIAVTGGTGPYSYSWDNMLPALEDQVGLDASTFTVQITDSNGCTSTNSIVVDEIDIIHIDALLNEVSCNGGNDGSIEIDIEGGVAPYLTSWTDDNNNPISDTEDLVAGTYSLTVIDSLGCEVSFPYEVTEPEILAVAFDSEDANCGSANGSIDLTVTGGVGPYTFDWNGGLPDQEDQSDLFAGNYSVTVTDDNGCQVDIMGTVNTPSALMVDVASTDLSCFDSSDGSISLSIAGGIAPYNIQWDGGLGNSDNLADLPEGNYSATIADDEGCEIFIDVDILAPDSISISSAVTNTLCNQNNGAIDLFVTGGTEPYTYQWSNNLGNNEDLIDLGAGLYFVTVTDDNGCEAVYSTSINTPSALQITAEVTDVSCNGFSDGMIDVNIDGGQAPYSYNWSNTTATEDLSNLGQGDYILTVTDGDGCEVTASFVVNEPAVLVATNETPSSLICFGSSAGTANIVVAGGVAPYTYDWSADEYDGLSDIQGLSAGSYLVTVIDANGCNTSEEVIIEESEPLEIMSEINPVSCFGNQDGSISTSVSGGTAPYNFEWVGTSITQSDINALDEGTYELIVTDDLGCVITNTYLVDAPEEIILTFNLSEFGDFNTSCIDSNDGSIETTVSGGAPGFTYSWSNGSTSDNLSNVAPGEYSLEITDDRGCTATESVSIISPPAIDLETQVFTPSCEGDTDGLIAVQATGGIAPYEFSINGNFFSSINEFDGIGSGSYEIIVQDASGCQESLNTDVPDAPPVIVDLGTDITLQLGDSVALDPQLNTQSVDTFFWSNVVTNVLSPFVRPFQTSAYELTVINADGCVGTDDIVVRVVKNRLLYVPNIFTPNDDGQNDIFLINGGNDVVKINSLQIFNRWGELVHEARDFLPGSIEAGWDGTFGGENLNPGVFVYVLEVLYLDDIVEQQTGDITLIK